MNKRKENLPQSFIRKKLRQTSKHPPFGYISNQPTMNDCMTIDERCQGDRESKNYMDEEILSGYLEKWTNYVNGFQNRWFLLKNGILSYYGNKDQVGIACKGSYSLNCLKMTIINSTNFKITTKSGITLYLRCKDSKNASKWISTINKALKKVRDSNNSQNSSITQPILNYRELSRSDSASDGRSLNESENLFFDDIFNSQCETKLETTIKDKPSTTTTRSSVFHWESELYERINKKCDIILSLESLLKKYKTNFVSFKENPHHIDTNNITTNSSDNDRFESSLSQYSQKCCINKLNSNDTFDMLERITNNISKEITELIPLIESYRVHTLRSIKDSIFKKELLQQNLKQLAHQYNTLERDVEKLCKDSRTDSKGNKLDNVLHSNSTSEKNLSDTMSEEFYDALSESMDSSSRDRHLLENDDDDDDDDDNDKTTNTNIESLSEKNPTLFSQQPFDNTGENLCVKISTSHHALKQSSSLNALQDHSNNSNHRSISKIANLKTLRKTIPPRPDVKLNLWGFIKNAIGKDLSKIPMPVNFNEPISMLQRVTEPLQHSSLLDQAAATTINDSLIQLVYVAAFNVSSYSSNVYRTSKPFNPLLNETFEMDRSFDLGWRSICEQVTHHPPACTLYAEGNGWNYTENFNAKSKFRGKYLSVEMLGLAHLYITKSKHNITWNKVTCTVNNIIMGTLSIDQTGNSEIVNHDTGDVCKLVFHSHSMFNKSMRRKVTGTVFDKDGGVHYVIDGRWDEGIRYAKVRSKNADGSYEAGPMLPLWTIERLPPMAETMYNFTEFTCSLNAPEPLAAPTDSRFRQDQRVMEEGDFQLANQLKCALEQKQRARRAFALNQLKERGGSLPSHCDEAIDPLWFDLETSSAYKAPGALYKYKGGYWEHKLIQDWSQCPDIFSLPNEHHANETSIIE